MDKRFLAILTGIAIIFIGIFVISGNSDDSSGGNSNNSSQPTNHVYGEGKKGVTIMEYGDFQCPACFSYYPIVNQVIESRKSDVYFQFRHLPLVQIHQSAFAAARAAEAASEQGKFFEMYAKLYDQTNWQTWTQSQSPKTYFETYAKEIGLNIEKYNSDYGSTKVNNAINADIAAFDKTKAEKSTPTFFINGEYVSNAKFLDAEGRPSVEQMTKVIDEAIAKENSQ